MRIWVPLLRPAILGALILLFVIAVRVLDLVVLLAGPGSRMLSVDIFLWTVTGRQEAASVLALLQTALVLAGVMSRRGPAAGCNASLDRVQSDEKGPSAEVRRPSAARST